MDEFDDAFADELDAMEDMEPPDDDLIPKSKRTLQFTTPKPKTRLESESPGLTPLESPSEPVNGSLLESNRNKKRTLSDTPTAAGRPEKRSRHNFESALDNGDDLWDDLPKLALGKKTPQGSKSARTVADDDISPPPSPGMTHRIVQHRNRPVKPTNQQSENLESFQARIVDGYDFDRRRVHTRIPEGNFIRATSSEGDRVYMILKDETTLDKELDKVGTQMKSVQLLAMPIAELKDQLEDERQRDLLAESQRLTAQINNQLNEDLELLDDDDKENEAEIQTDMTDSSHLLWVEKYTPRRYTDLLSEEAINRTLLHWIKMWDFVVFGKELKVMQNQNKAKKANIIKEKKFKKFQPEVTDEVDKHNRPFYKVALLCGPPGLGKTTLAHIIAKHAGYSVVEMNASDDRSADVFKTKVETATQMKAVLGPDPRPNCLIIDEIDGAPVAAINTLLNIIKKGEDNSNKKKKSEGGLLLRPIICICNDQYVPALRQLRQLSLVVNFPQTEPTKLAGRLYEVAKREQFKADINTLLALCEKTDNDIRSCLNTLQFVQRRCQELTMKIVQGTNTGQKDTHKSLFSVWQEIFTMPRPRKNRFVSLHDIQDKGTQVNNTSFSARFQNVLHSTQSSGEYEKVMQGMFENYLECKFKDPRMEGVTLATEWLCYVDQINQFIGHSQNYSLMPYIPYMAVIFHLLFASNVPTKLQFPHTQYEMVLKNNKSTNLVNSMLSDMLPSVRKYLNQNTVVMEVLPPLMDVLQPSLRPVNTQLYSAREKEGLAQLIRIMIAYNMTYHQEKSPDGQYSYTLDPNVDEVVRFTGMKQHRQLTYAAKQMIAREISLEKLRRSEAAKGGGLQPATSGTRDKHKNSSETSAAVIPNHQRQKLEAKPIQSDAERPLKDFFGRVIKKKTTEIQKRKEEKKNILSTDIWFHFKEGFSNAVRRNVKVQDLL